jgi:hypothetical protein
MRLVGAVATAQVTGLEELPSKSNYFISNDSTEWQTGIPDQNSRVRRGSSIYTKTHESKTVNRNTGRFNRP